MNVFLNEVNAIYKWNTGIEFSNDDLDEKFRILQDSVFVTDKAPNVKFQKGYKKLLDEFRNRLGKCKDKESIKTFLKDVKMAQKFALKNSDHAVQLSKLSKTMIVGAIAAAGLAFINPAIGLGALIGFWPGLVINLGFDNAKPIYKKVVSKDVDDFFKQLVKLQADAIRKYGKILTPEELKELKEKASKE